MQLKKFTLSFINTAKVFVICLWQCKVDELAQIERAQYHIILRQYKCCPLLKRFQILCNVYSNQYFRTKCLINSMHQSNLPKNTLLIVQWFFTISYFSFIHCCRFFISTFSWRINHFCFVSQLNKNKNMLNKHVDCPSHSSDFFQNPWGIHHEQQPNLSLYIFYLFPLNNLIYF